MTELETRIIFGCLPTFWNKDVLFIANLKGMFYENRAGTAQLINDVGGLNGYGGRLLPILNLIFKGGKNLLIVETAPDPSLNSYFREDLNLSLPEIELLSHEDYQLLPSTLLKDTRSPLKSLVQKISKHPAQWIDGFVTDKVLADLASVFNKSSVNSLKSSKAGNNKLLLHEYLREKELPIFDTFQPNSVSELNGSLRELKELGYENAVVKAQVGASGIGMLRFKIENARNLQIPEHLFFEGPVLLQGWIDETVSNVKRIGSPSIQLFLDDHCLYLYDLTEQILSSESVHQGNMSPPPYFTGKQGVRIELIRQGIEAAEWLHQQNYRGTASIDFQIIKRKRSFEIRICEINARITGATYPSILARHFMPDGAWLMQNLSTKRSANGGDLLMALRKNSLLYTPRAERGILPINFNHDDRDKVVKGQFLFLAGDLLSCKKLKSEMKKVIPLQWENDRD